MNNKVVTISVLLVILMLGGAAYMMSSRNSSNQRVSPSPTDSKQGDEGYGKKSLKELLNSGVSQKCTYKDKVANLDISGTTFIAGGKVRADFDSTTENKASKGHTIFNSQENIIYIWMDGVKSGFKMEIDPETMETSSTSSQQAMDLNRTMDYDCQPWTLDQSLFVPPSDVNFPAFGVTPSGDQKTNDSEAQKQKLCATCNSLSGEQKTQCLTAFSCN